MLTLLLRCIAAGVWPALPVTGYYFLRRAREIGGLPGFGAASAIGLATWTPLLLLAATGGWFYGPIFGALGWALLIFVRPPIPVRLPRAEIALLAIVAAGVAFLVAYPREELLGGRDNAVYANQALALARTGRLDLPSPIPPALANPTWRMYLPGFYVVGTKIVGQFGKFLVVWLAQSGIFSLSALFASLGALVFFGLCRDYMKAPFALGAAALYLFSPGSLWVARTTFSETAAATFIWAALYLLPRHAFWAGSLVGAAAFVRVDALLLPPLLLVYHAVFARDSTEMRVAVKAAFLWAGMAFLHYCVLTLPYIVDLRTEIAGIAVLASVSGAAYLLRQRLVRIWPRPEVAFLIFVQLVLAVVCICRNDLQIHELVETHSPYLLGLALAGWLTAVNRRIALPIVLLVGAFGALYLVFPSVNLRHFYVLRRYVPVLIPGLVFFAALAVQTYRVALVLTPLILVTVARTDGEFATREYRASYAETAAIAERLPNDVVFAEPEGLFSWMTPLAIGFGKRLVPLEAGSPQWREMAVPAYYLHEHDIGLAGLNHFVAARGVITGRALMTSELQTTARFEEDRFPLTLTRIEGGDAPVSHVGEPLVLRPAWDVRESGLYPVEKVEGRPMRWTDGHARVSVPLRPSDKPRALSIELYIGNPDGSQLTVVASGKTVFAGPVDPGIFRTVLPVVCDGEIEIRSDTFMPFAKVFGSQDRRTLGVGVFDVRLLHELRMPAHGALESRAVGLPDAGRDAGAASLPPGEPIAAE